MTAITSTQARPNREYKDSVFRDLFGSPERKEYALSLYNALNGTDYDDPEALEVTTLEDVVCLGRKNDASYLIDGRLVLWEQQSTPNPNMPLRGLGYLARLYEGWVAANDYNVHSSTPIRLPRPQYYVFYVGVTSRADRYQLRLSDAFGHAEGAGEPALEVVAEVVNINYGRNEGLMGECEALAGYARLVALAREYNGTMGRGDAVRAAIDACIAEGTLADYFRARKGEVLEMFLTDWSEEEQRRLDDIEKQRRYEEGERKGREEGERKGREEGERKGREDKGRETLARAVELVRAGQVDVAAASAILDVPEADILAQVG